MSGKRFAGFAIVAAVVCLFLEGVVFQHTALQTRSLQAYPLEVSAIPGQTEWTFDPMQLSEVHTISVTFSGTIEITRAELQISDDSHRYVRVYANEALFCPADPAYATRVMRCEPNGNLYGITLKWDKEGAVLESVQINEPVPYRFRTKRFLLMLAVALLVLYVRGFRLCDIVYDPANKKHKAGYAATAFVCMLFAVYLAGQLKPYDISLFPWAQQFEYPFTMPAEEYEPVPHVLMFDALRNGSPEIRVTPDARLAALDNPYDYSQREEAVGNYAYWWDYAYLDGKLYVYFGLAPVLLCYIPYYLVTGMLPSYVQVSLFLALLAVAGAFLATEALARRFAKGCRLYALCLAASAVVAGSQVFMLGASPARYHICIASAQGAFFFTVWTACMALDKTGLRRRVFLAASALCTALVVLSRPNVALLAGAWLTVLFLSIVFDKSYSRAEKTKDAAAYLVPVAVCGILIGAYNAWRFGSPLDFGMTHLLTLWDMKGSAMSLAALPKAIWCYGLEPMSVRTVFPWLQLQKAYVNYTGNYHMVNMAGSAGAAAVPLVWGNLVFVSSRRQQDGSGLWRALFAVSAVAVVFLALFSYCKAGVSERYVCDLLPALCLTGALCLLRVPGLVEGGEAGVPVRRLFTLVCVLTLVTAFSRCYGNEVNAVAQYAPQRYLSMVDLFTIR